MVRPFQNDSSSSLPSFLRVVKRASIALEVPAGRAGVRRPPLPGWAHDHSPLRSSVFSRRHQRKFRHVFWFLHNIQASRIVFLCDGVTPCACPKKMGQARGLGPTERLASLSLCGLKCAKQTQSGQPVPGGPPSPLGPPASPLPRAIMQNKAKLGMDGVSG
jgi:hypothetical protein